MRDWGPCQGSDKWGDWRASLFVQHSYSASTVQKTGREVSAVKT